MAELTIIVVTWNSAEHIERCLRSIARRRGEVTVRTIVIDNASSDGTAGIIRSHFPGVELVQNPHNAGFAAANNQGLRMSTTPYVLLLNPDAELQDGSLHVLVNFMESTHDAWVSGAALVNPDGSPQAYGVRFPSAWNILCETLFLDKLFPRSRLFGRHKELYEDQTKPRRVDFVQGAALCVRTACLNSVGELDESFFMYFEEADWCFRMKEAGGAVYFCPASRVVHHGGSPGHYDERRLVHYHRSLALFVQKHYRIARQVQIRVLVVFRSSVRILTWTAVWIARPSMRASAQSSIAGYLNVIAMSMGKT